MFIYAFIHLHINNLKPSQLSKIIRPLQVEQAETSVALQELRTVYRSTCALWRWAGYRIWWIGTLRWTPTWLVSAWATWLNKGQSSAQHVDHLTQNRWCLPPTRIVFEHLATAIVAGHLTRRVRGLRHRQCLQHIIHPLQVEQAKTSVMLQELHTS